MFDSIYTFFHSDILSDCTNQEKKEKCISFLKNNIIQEYDLPCSFEDSFEDVLFLLEKAVPDSKKILCNIMDEILFIMKCMQGISVNLEYGLSKNCLLTGDVIRTIIIKYGDTDYENVLFIYSLFTDVFFSDKRLLKCLR